MLPAYARSAIALMLLTGVATGRLAGCASIDYRKQNRAPSKDQQDTPANSA